MPDGSPAKRRTGRFGSDELRPDQDSPPSTDRHTPAALATEISSALAGETARSDNDAPRIELPLYAVRLAQWAAPSSDRKALRAKLYTRAPCRRIRAPGSGLFGAWPSIAGDGAFGESRTAFQVSKSTVSKVRPDRVRAYSVAPSLEYQTRSTGPVAADGSASSIALLPMCRQSNCQSNRGPEVGVCASASSPAEAAARTAERTVTLRHICRVYCNPFRAQRDAAHLIRPSAGCPPKNRPPGPRQRVRAGCSRRGVPGTHRNWCSSMPVRFV